MLAGPSSTLADGAADGCASRPDPRRGRSHTPPRWAKCEDRERTCTTTLLREHANRSEQPARTRSARGSARSSGKTVPALGPASFQNGTTATGAHPRPEAVLLRTVQVVGLVGALQRRPPGQAAPTAAETKVSGGRRCMSHAWNYTRLRGVSRCWQPNPHPSTRRPGVIWSPEFRHQGSDRGLWKHC